jgi:hypothetical protein
MLHFPPAPGITSGNRVEGLFLLSFQFRLSLDLPNGLQKQPLSPPLLVRYQPAPIVNEILRAFDKGKRVVFPASCSSVLAHWERGCCPEMCSCVLQRTLSSSSNKRQESYPMSPRSDTDGPACAQFRTPSTRQSGRYVHQTRRSHAL